MKKDTNWQEGEIRRLDSEVAKLNRRIKFLDRKPTEKGWRDAAIAVMKDCLPHVKAWVPENQMETMVRHEFLARIEGTIIEGEQL